VPYDTCLTEAPHRLFAITITSERSIQELSRPLTGTAVARQLTALSRLPIVEQGFPQQ
jgi:hypothetical protein